MTSPKPFCYHCGTEQGLNTVPMLNNIHLCPKCDIFMDTTFCGVCGIIGLRDDLVLAKDGDGPFCPDCCAAVDAEDDAFDWDDVWGDDDDDDLLEDEGPLGENAR